MSEIPDTAVFAGDEQEEIGNMLALGVLLEKIDEARRSGDHVTARRLESDYLGDYSDDQIRVARQGMSRLRIDLGAIVERPLL